MSKILAPIGKLNSREPKIVGGGMPARNTPTNAHMANCSGKNDGSVNVKATVAKVLSKIK
jgi:hypothetical protein